jgi:type IV pilus assembly protein PilV
MSLNKQAGIGMFEVLVALFILAIGVLGFSALQLRAVDASIEANDRTLAMNLAQDLAERIRLNRLFLNEYRNAINSTTTANCLISNPVATTRPTCTGESFARHDANEIRQIAAAQGQTIVMDDCHGSLRTCIYVAWGQTNIEEANVTQCMRNGSYEPEAKCIVMEAF